MQKVKDVFSDYLNKDENIYNADFLKANLYKRSNRLEVCLTSNEKLSIKEVSNFEDYIINRFKVGSARIEIQYVDTDIEPTIEDDWSEIVTYMSKKEPMTRAILRNSSICVMDNNIKVDLKVKGADLLRSKKFDKGLEHLIYNLYNKNFKVSFFEEEQKSKEEYDKYLKAQEHEAILHMQEIARREAEERALNKVNISVAAGDAVIGTEPVVATATTGIPGLIYGKTNNFKSVFAPIGSINNSTTKVNVEGEIVNVMSREIKNNRTIISFSIDDGDNSITCKLFVDTALVPTLLEKIKEGARC